MDYLFDARPPFVIRTSHKVMVTTLLLQDHLDRVTGPYRALPRRRPLSRIRALRGKARTMSAYLLAHWGFDKFLPGVLKRYLLVRDPRARLESFHSHITALQRRPDAPAYLPNNPRHHLFRTITARHFNHPVTRVPRKHFLELSFGDCVLALPALFRDSDEKRHVLVCEEHTRFQSQHVQFGQRYERILKMECEEDMRFMRDALHINTDIWGNRSKQQTATSRKDLWTRDMRDIVYRFYKEDFDNFGYDPYD